VTGLLFWGIMEPNWNTIPEELKARPQWVAWRLVEREGKPTKIPLDPKTGGPGKSNNPATWGTFEQAVAALKRNGVAGVGFVFSVDDPFVGIDLDHAFVDGQPRFCAKALIEQLNTYTENSPTQGKGFHIYLQGKLPGPGNKRKFKCGLELEVYDRLRFLTVTGHHLPGTPTTVEDRQAKLDVLHRQLFDSINKQKAQGPRSGPSPTLDLDDAELIDKAHKASNGWKFARLWAGDWRGAGYASHSEADLALCEILAFWSGGDAARIDRLFRQSGLYREKWNRPDYRERTISRALAQTTEFYTPGRGTDTGAGQNRNGGQTAQTTNPTPATPHSLAWPQEIMAGAAGRFAKTYSEYLETPPAFIFMNYLTFLGHLISSRITLKSELKPQPRLFVINLGESADDRKSTSINAVSSFYRETLAPEDLNIIFGVGSAEGLARCFKKNNRGILVLDELKSLIQKMRIDASVLLPCVNTLFEDKTFYSYTKKHEIEIDNAELCLLAASTLDTYSNMFNSTFLDIGFLNRLFIVIGNSERKFSIPETIPQTVKNSLRTDLTDVLAFVSKISQNGPYAMPIHSTALDIFDAWYFGLEKSVFAKRLDSYGHRLMPLLAVNEMLDIITPEIAEKTVSLLNYQLAARRYADPIDADNAIARLEERIRRLLAGGPLTKRELERKGNKTRAGSWAWETALNYLLRNGEAKFDRKTKSYALAE